MRHMLFVRRESEEEERKAKSISNPRGLRQAWCDTDRAELLHRAGASLRGTVGCIDGGL